MQVNSIIPVLTWFESYSHGKIHEVMVKQQLREISSRQAYANVALQLKLRRKPSKYQIYFHRFFCGFIQNVSLPKVNKFKKKRVYIKTQRKSNKKITNINYNFNLQSIGGNLLSYLILRDNEIQNDFNARQSVKLNAKSIKFCLRNLSAFALRGWFDSTDMGDWHYTLHIYFTTHGMLEYFHDFVMFLKFTKISSKRKSILLLNDNY